MTTKEQKKFVRDLSKSVVASIAEQIDGGRIPGDWDGHELRLLLAERFGRETTISDKRSSRYRNFRNTVVVNNL